MIKYNEFLNEGKKDIDPYGEEQWSPAPPQRRRNRRQIELEEWERERRLRNERELEFLREKCPSAYSTEQRGYFELRCNANEFEKLINNKEAGFAGNCMLFDAEGSFSDFLSRLRNQLNASKIEVGCINVTVEPYPGDDDVQIYGAAIYFHSELGRRQVRNLIDHYEPSELDRYEGDVWRVWWD